MFGAPPQDIHVTGLRFLELLRLTAHTEVVTTVTATATDRATCEMHARGDEEAGYAWRPPNCTTPVPVRCRRLRN